MFHLFGIIWLLLRLLVLVGIPVAIITRFIIGAARFAWMPPAAKRNYPAALWARFRWRWLCKSLALAWIDDHRKAVKPIPMGTSVKVTRNAGPRMRVRTPPASIRADEFGFVARVKTIPRVGHAEVEKQASHLANAWRAHRVSITQPRPGRLELRAFVREPLAEPLDVTSLPGFDGRHLHLGRDEYGDLRKFALSNHAAVAFQGNPGRGKTECARSLIWQLARSPSVELHILDGGGGLDWEPFAPGCVAYADDLPGGLDLLHDLAAGMNKRRRELPRLLGVRNGWDVGPTPEVPLRVLLVEEAPAFLSAEGAKGTRKTQVEEATGLITGLIRRGRAPLHLTILLSQIASTTGGLPPDIRNLCGVRWSFGVATMDTAVCMLGADIRSWESVSPTQLQGPEHVGIASCLLPTRGVPFTLVKFPAVGQAQSDRAALQLAQRRKPQVESAAPALALVASPPAASETPPPADAAAS